MRNGFYTEVTISLKEMNKVNGLHTLVLQLSMMLLPSITFLNILKVC
jgi:hypothetical protein